MFPSVQNVSLVRSYFYFTGMVSFSLQCRRHQVGTPLNRQSCHHRLPVISFCFAKTFLPSMKGYLLFVEFIFLNLNKCKTPFLICPHQANLSPLLSVRSPLLVLPGTCEESPCLLFFRLFLRIFQQSGFLFFYVIKIRLQVGATLLSGQSCDQLLCGSFLSQGSPVC